MFQSLGSQTPQEIYFKERNLKTKSDNFTEKEFIFAAKPLADKFGLDLGVHFNITVLVWLVIYGVGMISVDTMIKRRFRHD